jgi:hypothetical protein
VKETPSIVIVDRAAGGVVVGGPYYTMAIARAVRTVMKRKLPGDYWIATVDEVKRGATTY